MSFTNRSRAAQPLRCCYCRGDDESIAGRYDYRVRPPEALKPMPSIWRSGCRRRWRCRMSIESYGKGAIVGARGELGNMARCYVPGGLCDAQLSKTACRLTQSCRPPRKSAPSTALDVPLTHVNASYVRSPYARSKCACPVRPPPAPGVHPRDEHRQRVHVLFGGLAKEAIVSFALKAGRPGSGRKQAGI